MRFIILPRWDHVVVLQVTSVKSLPSIPESSPKSKLASLKSRPKSWSFSFKLTDETETEAEASSWSSGRICIMLHFFCVFFILSMQMFSHINILLYFFLSTKNKDKGLELLVESCSELIYFIIYTVCST